MMDCMGNVSGGRVNDRYGQMGVLVRGLCSVLLFARGEEECQWRGRVM